MEEAHHHPTLDRVKDERHKRQKGRKEGRKEKKEGKKRERKELYLHAIYTISMHGISCSSPPQDP
jgi:hypothetical protein